MKIPGIFHPIYYLNNFKALLMKVGKLNIEGRRLLEYNIWLVTFIVN